MGRCSDLLLLVRFETDSDELGQVGAALVEDAEGAIAGTGHGTGFLGHMAQQHRKFEVCLDKQHGVEHPSQC